MTTPAKGRADYYAEGDWNARCSMCGFKRKASQLVKNWQGMWRCREHDEPRDPQDFVRAVQDVQTPAWVQHTEDTYSLVCDLFGISSVADYAVADCAVSDGVYLGESDIDLTGTDILLTSDDDEPLLTDDGLFEIAE